jgi:iron complex outermembrane recepter protein
MGGAIQYVTQSPQDVFGARIRATAGSFQRRDVIANVDIPLTDTFLTKITAAQMRRDGYVNTNAGPGVKYGDENDSILRLQAQWLPSPDFTADFSITSTQRTPRYHAANVLYRVVEGQGAVMGYNAQGFPFTSELYAFGGREEYFNSSTYAGPGSLWDAVNANLNLTWDINDSMTFRSITGGRDFDWAHLNDMDGSDFAFFEQYRYQEGEELSQEFQLQGDTDNLTWTVGLYYSKDESMMRRVDWQYEEINPRPTNNITYSKREDQAIFAEGTYTISEQWRVTAGLRYSEEDFENAFYIPAEARPPHQVLTNSLEIGSLVQANAAKFDAVTARLSVQYDWTDNIMTYVTYSEGFNGGGVNGSPINGEFIPYDGERLEQFEVGLRSDLLDGSLRLNAAYFFGVWGDIQVGEVIVPGIITTQNAGEAEVEGFEVDAIWAATENLRINFSIGWLDTTYTELGNTTTIALNSSFPLAPELTYSIGATYDWQLDSGAVVTLRGDYGWTDEFVTNQDVRLQRVNESYGLLGARLVYRSRDDNWDLALHGSNLTDEYYQLGGFSATLGGIDQGVVARPREIGVTLNMRF